MALSTVQRPESMAEDYAEETTEHGDDEPANDLGLDGVTSITNHPSRENAMNNAQEHDADGEITAMPTPRRSPSALIDKDQAKHEEIPSIPTPNNNAEQRIHDADSITGVPSAPASPDPSQVQTPPIPPTPESKSTVPVDSNKTFGEHDVSHSSLIGANGGGDGAQKSPHVRIKRRAFSYTSHISAADSSGSPDSLDSHEGHEKLPTDAIGLSDHLATPATSQMVSPATSQGSMASLAQSDRTASGNVGAPGIGGAVVGGAFSGIKMRPPKSSNRAKAGPKEPKSAETFPPMPPTMSAGQPTLIIDPGIGPGVEVMDGSGSQQGDRSMSSVEDTNGDQKRLIEHDELIQ